MQNLVLIIIANFIFFSGIIFFQDGGQFFEDIGNVFAVNESVNAAVGAAKTTQLKARTVQKKKRPSLLSRILRKPTPAEKFATLGKELLEVRAKGSYISPDHANRIFADLDVLAKQGYARSELDRLRALAASLIARPNNTQNGQAPQGERNADAFAALERELQEVKARKSSLSSEHAQRIFFDIDILEKQGYSKGDIERLRALALELSPRLKVQEKPKEGGTCVSNSNPIFTTDVTDLSRISQITPPGVVMSGGVLKSHSYLWIADGGKVPVYAPIDADLVAGVYLNHPDGNLDYGLIFQISCEVEFRLGHITDPIERIRAALPATPKEGDSRDDSIVPISFKAGDLLGYTSGTGQAHNWDFGVYNTARPDPDAQAFGATGKDARANCAYDYFASEKQSVYRSLFNNEIGGRTVSVRYCD